MATTRHRSLSELLRDRRTALGLSREQAAVAADTSSATLARIELSGHVPSVAVLVRLGAVLQIPEDELMQSAVQSDRVARERVAS